MDYPSIKWKKSLTLFAIILLAGGCAACFGSDRQRECSPQRFPHGRDLDHGPEGGALGGSGKGRSAARVSREGRLGNPRRETGRFLSLSLPPPLSPPPLVLFYQTIVCPNFPDFANHHGEFEMKGEVRGCSCQVFRSFLASCTKNRIENGLFFRQESPNPWSISTLLPPRVRRKLALPKKTVLITTTTVTISRRR